MGRRPAVAAVLVAVLTSGCTGGPWSAAFEIAAAERAISDPGTSARDLTAAAHSQQVAYRELADHPAWDARVLELLPRDLRRTATDNVAARRAFRSMHPSRPADLATELPAWQIVAPRPARELRRYYRGAERRYGVDWEYLAAINLVETGFGRIQGTSVAGAQGPMQFIPETWERYGDGGDVNDPRDAIPAAARLLRDHGFADDRAEALYHYNNSSAYVRGVTLYAEVMQRRPRAYLGYHQWPIYYLTRRGSILLPEGYAEQRPVGVGEWLARADRSPSLREREYRQHRPSHSEERTERQREADPEDGLHGEQD